MADNITQAEDTRLPWEIDWNDRVQATKDASNETPAALGTLVSAAANPWDQDFGAKRVLGDFPTPSPMTPQASVTSPQSFNQVFAKLINTESGGRHVDDNGNLITSSKGAKGITQVMPATGDNPGFGVTPLQNNSPEEYVRFGKDYLGALIKEFGGNTEKAVAAYNAGPGTIKKAIIQANKTPGADWTQFIPTETKKYITKILGNTLAAVTGSTNANAAADFSPYLASNKTETGPTAIPKGGSYTTQTNALGAKLVGIIQKDFPDHVDAINTKVTADMPSEGATADYGGLGGDKINLGKLVGSETFWTDSKGKRLNADTLPTSKVNEALATTLHEIQHARMDNVTSFNAGLGDNWRNMLNDAADHDFPSVSKDGVKNGDMLNEFLATATTLKEMQRRGYAPSGRYAEPAAALPALEKKYPWLKQYIINYIYPEAENSASNRKEVQKARTVK